MGMADELFEGSDEDLFVTRQAERLYERLQGDIVATVEQTKEGIEELEAKGIGEEAYRRLLMEAAAEEMHARGNALLTAMEFDRDLVIERTRLQHELVVGR